MYYHIWVSNIALITPWDQLLRGPSVAVVVASCSCMATALLRTRYKLCIQYNGTRYKGWQTQPDDLEKSFRKTSVQSVLEVRYFGILPYFRHYQTLFSIFTSLYLVREAFLTWKALRIINPHFFACFVTLQERTPKSNRFSNDCIRCRQDRRRSACHRECGPCRYCTRSKEPETCLGTSSFILQTVRLHAKYTF